MSEYERRLELFCPVEFHGYSGVDVCLSVCRKRICSVFKMLQKEEGVKLGVRVGKRLARSQPLDKKRGGLFARALEKKDL